MKIFPYCILILTLWKQSAGQTIVYQNDMNFRIEPGGRTCFFEKGRAGQMMEAQYQVIDGQHGDLDISFEIKAPNGEKILNDYKRSQNSIIMELDVDGDYVFCMDNSFSVMNSKLVFVYVLIENKPEDRQEAEVSDVEDGEEQEVLEWMGTYEDGDPYFLEVTQIADSLTRTLKHVIKARHLLNMHGAMRTRDNYLAFEDTFIVDVWSGFQISLMFIVGTVQVYMIKKLFNRPAVDLDSFY